MLEEIRNNNITNYMLISKVMTWAGKNDKILYNNLDYIFEDFKCRNSFTYEDVKETLNKIKINENITVLELLIEALNKSDYHDTLRFMWTFQIDSSQNSYIKEWKYESRTPNPYSDIIPYITARLKYLEENNLDDWHKSKDIIKHKHYRWWIQNILDGEESKIYSMMLFHENDTRCFNALHLGNNMDDNCTFNILLKYILDEYIIPDPHHSELTVPDFANFDYDNPRKLTKSAKFGGFHGLIYLTAEELQYIYKNKIKKYNIDMYEKNVWAYINSLKYDPDNERFYILIK